MRGCYLMNQNTPGNRIEEGTRAYRLGDMAAVAGK
jgi:hypothetical protein